MKDNLSELPQNTPGYPDRSPDFDVLPGFKNVPNGYGPVPFYWWVGENLTRERLLWQLDKVHQAGIEGLSISYAHSHPDSDPDLNENGYGEYGMTYPSDPPFFSDDWWSLFNWYAGECAKRNMGVGLDDYTFCTPGNKQWPDDIAALPEMRRYRGKLRFDKPVPVKKGQTWKHKIDGKIVSLSAYRQRENGLDGESMVDLLNLAGKDSHIVWTVPDNGDWKIIKVSTTGSFMLHPHHGEEVIKRYFQKFENHVDPENRKGLNYFFQDELVVELGIDTWSEDFAEQFEKRKGYDIRPYLAALHHDIGPKTPKIRIDHMDVVVSLAEERYFRPIFEWHTKRGLIFGCDNYGRGLEPTSYGDYFRVTRWFTAPGNDAPQGRTALIQTKVSSSISHLYHRPRVWLEAFHSMGWDARPELITKATDIHYQLGGNLLCLHGLYYSTYGGWWEWAPPDFHFRMPYWPHITEWFKYIKRLSYLLSQGHHVCDVAVLYPTTSMQAYSAGRPNSAFAIARQLYDAGIDFDFIDYASLARSKVKDGKLHIAGESYQVLILGNMKAMRFTSLSKARELFRNGGLVVATGAVPEATDCLGENDPEVDDIVKEIFGLTATQALAGRSPKPQHSGEGGMGTFIRDETPGHIAEMIKNEITCDFIPLKGLGHVLHRRIGKRDIYMVMDMVKGMECFFRSKGKVELWDAWTGEIQSLPIIRTTEEGTVLRIPVAPPKSCLIVFSPGEPDLEQPASDDTKKMERQITPITGEWACEIVPTMDNRWGDFRLPATNTLIGPEARQLRFVSEDSAPDGWQDKDFDDSKWPEVTCGFGPQMWMMHIPVSEKIEAIERAAIGIREDFVDVEIADRKFSWSPYNFSWRWGVENQPGSQGYHGLKGKLDNNFMIMGEGGHYIFGSFVHITKTMTVKVVKSGMNPSGMWIDGIKLENDTIRLSAGRHKVLISYRNITGTKEPEGPHRIDQRARAAIAFVEDGFREGTPQPLAMKWYTYPGLVRYDYLGGKLTSGCYRFTAPPGLKTISFAAHGEVTIWVNGTEMAKTRGRDHKDNSIEYTIDLKTVVSHFSTVAIRVVHRPGYYNGATFPEPITLTCTKGLLPSGDWSKMGVLKDYSGGMWYRRNITLSAEQAQGEIILDLGKVIATCEVHVNGKKAGILMTAPFSIDISRYVTIGDNHLEILVYNTLSNHYQTIPTPEHYKKTTISGLIGPVQIINHGAVK